jgi:hypothetical protein
MDKIETFQVNFMANQELAEKSAISQIRNECYDRFAQKDIEQMPSRTMGRSELGVRQMSRIAECIKANQDDGTLAKLTADKKATQVNWAVREQIINQVELGKKDAAFDFTEAPTFIPKVSEMLKHENIPFEIVGNEIISHLP